MLLTFHKATLNCFLRPHIKTECFTYCIIFVFDKCISFNLLTFLLNIKNYIGFMYLVIQTIDYICSTTKTICRLHCYNTVITKMDELSIKLSKLQIK